MDSSSKVVMLFGSHEKFSGVEIPSNPAIIQCIEITLFSIDFGEVVWCKWVWIWKTSLVGF